MNYTFRAIYKSDGSNIKLINIDISKTKEMIVDKKKVFPSIHYSFNDSNNHEIFMLLNILIQFFKELIK